VLDDNVSLKVTENIEFTNEHKDPGYEFSFGIKNLGRSFKSNLNVEKSKD
jgi:hypothetical protein